MTRVEVVAHDGSASELDQDEPVVVSSGDVVLVIRDAPPGLPVRLDGILRGVTTAGSTIVPIDLTRSTGYHRLHLPPGRDYWFATEDAKLGLDGIERMLAYLRGESRTWSGQLLFADGSYLRDPHIVFGWLDQYADAAVHAARAVAARPLRSTVSKSTLTASGGGRLDLQRTIRTLRRRPRDLLEKATLGPVTIHGQQYAPRIVAVREQQMTLDTRANRRCVWLLQELRGLAQEVLESRDPGIDRDRLVGWILEIDHFLLASPLARLAGRGRHFPEAPEPATEELTDHRYRAIRDISEHVAAVNAWSLGRERRPSYSYVAYADRVFQAFAVHVIADALGADLVASPLGSSNPAFRSDDMEIYYDCQVPPTVARTWRSYSDTPDAIRPDVLIRFRDSGAIALADAKYRSDGARASESSRSDLMAYLNAFGLRSALIFYPPSPPTALAVRVVEGQGRTLIEFPIAPVEQLPAFLDGHLANALALITEAPPWKE